MKNSLLSISLLRSLIACKSEINDVVEVIEKSAKGFPLR